MPLRVEVIDSYYHGEVEVYSRLQSDESKNTIVIYVSSAVTNERPEGLIIQVFFRATKFYEVFDDIPAEAFRKAIRALQGVLGNSEIECISNDRQYKLSRYVKTFYPYVSVWLKHLERDTEELKALVIDLKKAFGSL